MKCAICLLDMHWRINGEVLYQGQEYLGNNMSVYMTPEVYRNTKRLEHFRCCDWCDRFYELPARMGMKGEAAIRFGRAMIESDVLARDMMRQLLNEKAMGADDDENDDSDNERHDE